MKKLIPFLLLLALGCKKQEYNADLLVKNAVVYTVDKKTVAVSDLPTVLAGYKKLATELTIVLYVDKTVAIQDVVSVMDVSQKLNIKLVLATEPK